MYKVRVLGLPEEPTFILPKHFCASNLGSSVFFDEEADGMQMWELANQALLRVPVLKSSWMVSFFFLNAVIPDFAPDLAIFNLKYHIFFLRLMVDLHAWVLTHVTGDEPNDLPHSICGSSSWLT